MAYENDGVKQIEVNELLELIEEKPSNTIFLDVREHHEYNAGHIPGVKILPTSQFAERYEAELEKDKDYVVICRSGNRSQMVCKFLQAQGFTRLVNYAGGMLEWTGKTEEGNLPVQEGN